VAFSSSQNKVRHFSNAVASVVGTVLGGYYYHHATLEAVFTEAGAPGEPPEGNCEQKCVRWLKRTSNTPELDGLTVLGRVLEEFMDTDLTRSLTLEQFSAEKARVLETLRQDGLDYLRGGRILAKGAALAARQLEDILRARDLGGMNKEFERALNSVGSDPGAAVTAACAILEALCKVYIQDEGLALPSDQSIQPLWRAVQPHLGLDPKSIEDNDLKQILSGLSSITHGLGSFRTHVGSAHGRGRNTYRVAPRHARLVVNASHTLAMFMIETWDARTQSKTA
jgi:hypothetical protein